MVHRAREIRPPDQAPVIAAGPLSRTGRIRDIQIGSAGHMPAKANRVNHGFKLHGVGLVVAGHGSFRVGNGRETMIGPGSAFCVYPGPVFHYGPAAGTTWEERYVTFFGDGLARWYDAGWLWRSGEVHQLASWSDLVDQHRQLQRLLSRGHSGDHDRAVVLTERYLLEMHYARASLQQIQHPGADMESVLAHCRAHHPKRIDFHALARRHAMSYSSLRQRLLRVTGLPPARYVTHLRCEAARALLADTDLPIKAIAVRVGVPDLYTFSRTFKRCVGLSPRHYRRRHAPWQR